MKDITPYINFDGTCREALNFYQKAIGGGELSIVTFAEAGMNDVPGAKDRIIHGRLAKGSTVIMASDTMPGMPFTVGNNMWLNFFCDTDDEVQKLFTALSAGGKDIMAPHDSFWGARFAMLTDRFGINWMLNHERVKHG